MWQSEPTTSPWIRRVERSSLHDIHVRPSDYVPQREAPRARVSSPAILREIADEVRAEDILEARAATRAASSSSLRAERASASRGRALSVVAACVVGAVIGAVGVAMVQRHFPAPAPSPLAVRAPVQGLTAPEPVAIAPAPARVTSARVVSAPETPWVPVPPKPAPAESLRTPPPSAPAVVGTISLTEAASFHRLFVDGRLAPGGTLTVSCGTHVVQVGGQGVSREVTVPCGEVLTLDN